MQKSESIAELAKALSAAQGEIENAKKDAENPFFKSKYADLASVREAYQKPLSKHGLALVQTPHTEITEEGMIVSVTTILMHSSGEWISGELSAIPVKADPQGIGSCTTYLRRYGAGAITGVAADDDDGNAASRPSDNHVEPKKAQPKPTAKSAEIAQLKKAVVDACQVLNRAGDVPPWTAKRVDEFAVEHYGVKADVLELEPLRELVKTLSLRMDRLKNTKKDDPEAADKASRIASIKESGADDGAIQNAFAELKISMMPLEKLSLDALVALDEFLSVPF